MFNKMITALGLVLAMASTNALAIVIATTTDADVLAGNILGGGITIVPGTTSYTGGAIQSGTFTDGSVIGFESGIILTSGNANLAPGPNVSDSAGLSNGFAGDADLNALIPQNTFNAAVLEFDFETAGGDLFFNFVFASEEYNEYANTSFNDVFAFFVDGTNIALAPDGQVASINNINCGNPYIGVGPNCSSFNNNDLNDGGPFFDIEYDGFTDVLTAEALGLGAGEHHIKIAIADAGDGILDSAVFIQSGTFSDEPTSASEPGILALMSLGLALAFAGTITRRRKEVS